MTVSSFGILTAIVSIQAALDAASWRWVGGKKIEIETIFPTHVAEVLARKGHVLQI